MGQFEKEETFLKPYKHNIYYYFMKNSCVGDIGTVRLHTCCITHINEWEVRFAVKFETEFQTLARPFLSEKLQKDAVFKAKLF